MLFKYVFQNAKLINSFLMDKIKSPNICAINFYLHFKDHILNTLMPDACVLLYAQFIQDRYQFLIKRLI